MSKLAACLACIDNSDTIFAMADSTPYNTMKEIVGYWKDQGATITDEQFGAPVSKVLALWDNGDLDESCINQLIGIHRDDQAKARDAFWA